MNILDKVAGFSRTDSDIDQFELHLVRETQAVKVYQSHYVLPLVIIVGLVYIVSLWDDAPRVELVVWEVLILLAACFRAYKCNHIENRLADADQQELYTNEQWLFGTSLASTLIIGSGFWWICIDGTDRTVFAVTLLSCMYAIGTTINSSVRFNNFPILVIANLGQGILFLSGLGRSPDFEVSAALISITLILIQFGKRNSKVFAESIRTREEIRKQNIRLEQARDKEKEANEGKSRFLAAASHDLRQPLYAMTTFLGSLKATEPSPQSLEIIEKIEEANSVLSEQFNSLLDLSKFDAGVIEVNYSEFDFDKLLHSIIDSAQADSESKGLSLTLETGAHRVSTDKLLIERLVRNLVLNAITYTERGSVAVRAWPVTGGLRFSVTDTGPGISKRDREKIFDEYFQTDNPERAHDKGSGLGLAIVKRIGKLLDLEIELDSEPGRGTRFTVTLPTSTAVGGEPPDAIAVGAATEPDYALENLNILVIDDNPMNRESLSGLLKTWQCVPLLAATPDEARTVVAENQPIDFAIIDDMLGPAESGLDLAESLSPRLESRPVIVTGNALPERLREIRNHGFEVYLKPVAPARLRKLIANRSLNTFGDTGTGSQ